MLKQINGSCPLRGFARELINDGDDTLARRSMTAVAVMGGDDSRMLVDETGNVITETVVQSCSHATLADPCGSNEALQP